MTDMPDRAIVEKWIRPIGFGIGHHLIATLSLSLAIPPGYSSPIWPAAAVVVVAFWKLGTRALVPIFLSAFLLNFDPAQMAEMDIMAMLSHVAIACGTVVQGVVGGVVARHLEARDPRLSKPRVVIRYFVILGPVVCLINATFSVSLLMLMGYVDPSHALMNWLTWWTGDTLGIVLAFAPLYLWFSAALPRERSRSQLILLSSLVLVGITIFIYQLAVDRHFGDLRSELVSDADEIARRVESARFECETLVESVDALLTAIPDLSAEEFENFAVPLSERIPAIHALEWISYVTADDRAEYEARMRGLGNPGFSIIRRNTNGVLEGAQYEQDKYFPITYVAPFDGNERAFGFDLGSDSIRLEALAEAHRYDTLVSTRPIILIQEEEMDTQSYLVLSPVHSPRIVDVSNPNDTLRGYACAVIRTKNLVRHALDRHETGRIHFSIRDPRAPETEIFVSEDAPAAARMADGAYSPTLDSRETYVTASAGQTSPWQIRFYFADELRAFSNWWSFWLMLLAGSVCAFVATIFLTTFSAQPEEIQRVVDEKTSELKRVSDDLRQLNAELESRVARRTEQLAVANRDLNIFVRSVSHDLQAPLSKLSMFVDVIEDELGHESHSPNVKLAVGAVSHAATSMRDLVKGLLALSRADDQPLQIEPIALDGVVDEVLSLFADDVAGANVMVHRDPLPVVYGDRRLLTQLYQNLVDNAIKFSARQAPSKIRFSSMNPAGSDPYVMTVGDNGIGIPREHRTKILQPFMQVDSQADYPGSGIGLSVCERIVQRLKGRIWVEDSPLGGAQFCFTVPQVPNYESP